MHIHCRFQHRLVQPFEEGDLAVASNCNLHKPKDREGSGNRNHKKLLIAGKKKFILTSLIKETGKEAH